MQIKPEESGKCHDGGNAGLCWCPQNGPVSGSGQGSREGFSHVTSSQSGETSEEAFLEERGCAQAPF